MRASRMPFLMAFLMALLLATACAPARRSHADWGWFAAPARFSMASDGADWSFAVDDRDLVLRNHSRSAVLADFVPEDGVRYLILDEEEPHLRFRSTDGEDAEWEGDEVERGDQVITLVEAATPNR